MPGSIGSKAITVRVRIQGVGDGLRRMKLLGGFYFAIGKGKSTGEGFEH